MNQQLAGLTPAQRDALRVTGATIFATGALALFLRKNLQDSWAAFPRLLVLAIPCVLLYGLGTGMIRLGRPDDDAAVTAWRAAALVFGLILIPFTLFQLVDTLGGDPDKSGHNAWVFAVTAAAGAYAAFVHRLRWGALFGGLAAIVSWIAFWDAVADPSATTVRWLFLIAGVALAAAAFRFDRAGAREGTELVTAAGVAGVAAGITGLISLPTQLLGAALAETFGAETDLSGTQQQQEWDVFLLVLALALIWYGMRAVWRGPVYVGAIALLAFILSVGIEVSRIFDGDAPSGDLIGWPLLLLVLGGAALAAGLYGGGGTTPVTQPDAGGTAPSPSAPPGPPPPPRP
jgi:hypothetical protein